MTGALTPKDEAFLDRYSGKRGGKESRDVLEQARRETAFWRPTIDPATVPGFDEVATALGSPRSEVVEGFLLHAH